MTKATPPWYVILSEAKNLCHEGETLPGTPDAPPGE